MKEYNYLDGLEGSDLEFALRNTKEQPTRACILDRNGNWWFAEGGPDQQGHYSHQRIYE